MSFRGRSRGGFRGGRGGGGFKGGRGGGGFKDYGPPEHVVEFGNFSHPCQDDLVVKVSQKDVPYFNAPIYLENKQQIGKIDEIFGTLRDYFVSVKLSDDIKASSFKEKQLFYIDPAKLLPLTRFLPGGQPRGGGRGRGRGGNRGRGGGGRGFSRGGGGNFRGGRSRGGGNRGFRGRY